MDHAVVEWLKIVGALVAPSGVAVVTLRAILNGSAQRIKRISEDVTEIKHDVKTHETRISRLEGAGRMGSRG